MTNPLLDFRDLPLFDQIRPEHVAPAVDVLLADAEAALQTVTAPEFPSDWNAIAKVLDVASERFSRAWGAVGHLNAVADTPELRAAYNEAMPRVTAFWTRLGSDERLYAKYKAIDPATLNAEQRQAHRNAVRNFVLGGAELQGEAKKRFAEIQERQAELSQKFSENALDATDAFAYYAQLGELDGLPEDVISAARTAAEAEGKQGYKLTLKMPSYLPVMQFARSSALREKLYRAYVTRASEFGDPALDNTELIREILALRQEEAKLLGYPNFGELSIVPKMAESADQVIKFLRDLANKARPFGERDLADLRVFASQQLSIDDPQPWDWSYIGEKLKEARYAFSEQEVKQYFPAPKVMAGLFKIVETLFEVSIRRDSAPVWHPSVEFYRIERQTSEGRQKVGQFYLDPSARAAKRGGAWMDDVRARWLRPDTGTLQTPVAQLVCNFADGVDGKPPLLTHDDVTTLFHEFGHGLHHMLTQVNERDVSGISGVEWDAVELPSQFMENFCWEWEVLVHMTAHVDTGEPLPRALFDKMIAAKNFQSGLQTLRQIEFSLFDMLLHTEHDATTAQPGDVMALLGKVRAEVAVMPSPPFSRTPNTFSHIFSGGYAAGYYSYKWAEVLSADAYAAFEETAGTNGQPSIETGRRYREAILEAGGSRTAMESFKAFRGREPQLDALLRHQGMTAAQPA
ncbi:MULTISPECIES: M3 family metallopeptidase [unclassified Variovorax]|uniref:M3 family metallopeptidase n=1 Tax=unclassified Variovorax TaxID=663243 RepID=UPI00076C8E37|nr:MULTISPECIES: M3 family metallopeptidase [unclassified Variovorax]KWT98773.1 Oligopeptidase A [Variovorax sp. WDL1]PNG56164.1 Oligopeptidase A [Variovorax sp. B4]PNG57588.1 Oligopeptidase A [Variovorax sp. B2]VTV10004.1 Oligopeptidase A [Variovorax sp. WDL1]